MVHICQQKPDKRWFSHNATPDDKTGTATFQVGDSATLTMNLDRFEDYHSICALMDAAYTLGFADARETIKDKIGRLTGEL